MKRKKTKQTEERFDPFNPEYRELLEKYAQSGGSNKMWNYFLSLTKSSSFQKTIKYLKKKYDIPENGYLPKRIDDMPGYAYRASKEFGVQVSIDGYILPPEEWLLKHNDEDEKGYFLVDIMNLCSKSQLHWLYWKDVIRFLLFYNKIYRIKEADFDVCMLVNLEEEAREPTDEAVQSADNQIFPFAIRISPYASQRDIVDYIKRVYKTKIGPSLLQLRNSQVRIGKEKRKRTRIQERNDFIYKMREFPRKRIMQLLGDKYGLDEIIDVGYIGKIISQEIQKRK